jgi:transposase
MSKRPSSSPESSTRPPPRLRQADREQMIPAMRLEDLLEQDHPARLVWEFCLGLDLSCLYDQIRSRASGRGRAVIDPRICVALWLYATLQGVGSARALARLCEHHNAFRWLVGGVSVNHHTLSDFRVEHAEVLDKLLTHSVAVLRQQGLVDLDRVAHDGMRVRASAGAASFRRQPTLQECLAEAEDLVARLKEQMDDDPAAPSPRHASARERAARERNERLEKSLERVPEMEAKKKDNEKDKARVSSTDPSATVMKMADGGFRPAYNLQYTASCQSQVIVAVEVLTSGSDMGQLKPQIQQVHKRTGVYPKEALADGGFAKHTDIEEIERECGGCKVYTPVPEPKDPKVDRYAPHRGDSAEILRWRARMGSAEGKEIYKQRASTAECVNAQARNRGLLRLLVRGVEKVKSVALWFAIAHNVACGWRLRLQSALRRASETLWSETARRAEDCGVTASSSLLIPLS